MERTVICYHGNCPDGFGGAYSAWKKFGDTAEYRPLSYGKPVPEDLAGANVYFIDFCYPKEVMDRIAAAATSFTVLDHHLGTKEVVESFPHHVFDENRSGASIAWSYFHPNEPVPELLSYVEDGDLYRHVLPNAQAFLAYIYAQPFSFEGWDTLRAMLADPAKREQALATGLAYSEYRELLVRQCAGRAEPVMFEGYECWLTNATSSLASDVGHAIYEEHPPIAIIAFVRADGIRVSLRGNGAVDLSAVARKYGGNGHPNAAGFSLPWGTPIPWTPITHEDTGD